MNLTDFVAALRRYRVTFVLVSAAVFILGLTWILLSPAKYVSSTQLMVSIEGSTTAAAYQNDEVVSSRINSYIPLLTSGAVTERVIDELGLPLTSAELAAKINATNVPPRTAIIDVAVTDESPAGAQLLARTLANEFVSYTKALETPTGEDSQKVHTTVVTAAGEGQANRAEPVLLGALAGVAALLVGAVAVWTHSRSDPIVRTADQAEAAAGAPVLGCVTAAAATSIDELDAYRRLRIRLEAMANRAEKTDHRGRVLVLASSFGEVTIAPVAANLGRAMELAGMRPIVLDACNPGTDAVAEPLGRTATGNIDGPAETADGPGNNTTESCDGARVITAPRRVMNGSEYSGDELLEVPPAATVTPELIDRLRGDYEPVIVAAPPVLPTTAAPTFGEIAAEVLLVLSIGGTTRHYLTSAVEKLRAMGAPPTGVVLTGKMDERVGRQQGQWRANTEYDEINEGNRLA